MTSWRGRTSRCLKGCGWRYKRAAGTSVNTSASGQGCLAARAPPTRHSLVEMACEHGERGALRITRHAEAPVEDLHRPDPPPASELDHSRQVRLDVLAAE